MSESATTFRKSSFSGDDNCVEVGGTLNVVRDTKNPSAVVPMPLAAFVEQVKTGAFDLPTTAV